MYPRSRFRYPGTSECTLVPVFGIREHPNVPSFRFLVPGNTAKTTLFEHPTMFRALFKGYPEGLGRHLNASQQKLTPHCLAANFDSQLPSRKLSSKMPPRLPLPHERGFFFIFQNYPRHCAAIEQQKLSRGNFCLAAFRCLSGPSE